MSRACGRAAPGCMAMGCMTALLNQHWAASEDCLSCTLAAEHARTAAHQMNADESQV